MPSNETPKYAFLFGIIFIIFSILMFFAVYNTQSNDTHWVEDYFGGLVSSIFFGILGAIFVGVGLYSFNRE